MKKLFVFTVLLLFIIGTPGSTLAAKAEQRSASQICKSQNNLGFSTIGQCLSMLRVCDESGNTGAVCTCKEFLNSNPQRFFDMYNSVDDCISHLRDGYVAE